MTVVKLATRDQTVHCASTTNQTAKDSLEKERVDATEALAEEAAKAAEAVAGRSAVATGQRSAISAASLATMQTNATMPLPFKRF